MLQRAPDGLWPSSRGASRCGRRAASSRPTVPPLARAPLPPAGEVLLEVQGATKRFGGLVASTTMTWRCSARRDPGADRPERRRQEHDVQSDLRCARRDRGTFRFRGRRVAGLPSREIARLGLSRTFQHVRLLPQMTVLENVAIGAHLRGTQGCSPACSAAPAARPRDEARLLAEARARSSGSAWPITCSTQPGQPAARASSASSRSPARSAADPCLLLLDEPAAGLRYLEKRALADLLRKLRARAWRSCWSSTTWIS